MDLLRRWGIWLALFAVLVIPAVLAAQSPLLQWRNPIYIAAGLAGVCAMSLLILQPLLAARALPGLTPRRSRLMHRITGLVLVVLVIVHIAGLWITSPPDVIDALTFMSPTPFSIWGVLAMWALFAAAAIAIGRRHLPRKFWRPAHLTLAVLIIVCTVLHALLIEGTMVTTSKWVLAAFFVIAVVRLFLPMRPNLK